MISLPVILAAYGYGKMVSSVSPGQAATNSKNRGGQESSLPCDPMEFWMTHGMDFATESGGLPAA